jgi:hypothetical protein
MKWQAKGRADGGFDFPSDLAHDSLVEDVKKHVGTKYEIKRLVPESKYQRGFYEGAVIVLWIYLDGKNHHSSQLQNQYHDFANLEYGGEILMSHGKSHLVGTTSKGKLNERIEQVIEMLEEEYGIDRTKVLDVKDYKYFINEVYMHGEYFDYIDYLKKKGVLK